ncbi:MAG: MerR family transcriptional regulator [Pseudomonadota bacterium]
MTHRTYTIGEASRLSGISVRRLRFYSDEGLLPPAGRTDSGYRVYTDADLVRLDLIRCLRDAGLGLDAIRNVLRRDLSLRDALKLRLETIELDIAAQRRAAAALRAALRSPELTETDLRRYWTMTTLSRGERRTMIEQFYAQVAQGTGIDTDWMRRMIEASTPELPDDPSPEQCDAWIELADILKNPSFIANMRSNASELWGAGFDHEAYAKASTDIVSAAQTAIAEGLTPTSEVGGDLARRWFVTSAQLMGREPNQDFKAWLRQKYAAHDPRAARYWELVAILKGQPTGTSPNREWNWIVEAMRHHLADG